MSYLLDTNVISELVRPKPVKSVLNWVEQLPSSSLYISVITLGEIRKGINGIQDIRRQETISRWLEDELPSYFGERILVIDEKIADKWGYLQSNVKGHSFPAIDAFIAATALVHQLKLVTRNVKDFRNTSVELINPWDLD